MDLSFQIGSSVNADEPLQKMTGFKYLEAFVTSGDAQKNISERVWLTIIRPTAMNVDS